MNKDYLKQYIANYGGVQVLEDIASILQELSQEWAGVQNKTLEHVFSDTAFMLADAANRLDVVQTAYAESLGEVPDNSKYQLEFNKLMYYFQTLSIKDMQKAYIKNKDEFLSKLKRLEYLKKLLNIKDNAEK